MSSEETPQNDAQEDSEETTSSNGDAPDASAADAEEADGDGEQASGAEQAEGAKEPEEAPAEPSLEDKLAAAQALAKQNREKMLRVAADFENFRRRSQREVDDARKRGMQSIVKDLLAVFDNLERATANINEDTSVDSVAEGLRMVHKQFLDLIGKRGIERVEALGQPFDPNVHEAIQYDESEEYDAGIVMMVLQPGYKMGEQLLRPALVMVSRGKKVAAPEDAEPKPEASDPDDGAAEADAPAGEATGDDAPAGEKNEENADEGTSDDASDS